MFILTVVASLKQGGVVEGKERVWGRKRDLNFIFIVLAALFTMNIFHGFVTVFQFLHYFV